ncbi:MAG: hypothetical protein H7A24_17415 [Leptospiraceae bacterium]|nr:hypothetical protein [Leptospiraceae bacterium]MCP5513672.1 hypothetical protein [Leptospiraceae bacterium]
MSIYDLTTEEGKKDVFRNFKEVLYTMSPLLGVSKLLIDKVFSHSDEIAKQAEIATKIIKTGKENGVSEMKIKVSQEAGIKIKSEFPDLPLSFNLGNEGKMEITVKYK